MNLVQIYDCPCLRLALVLFESVLWPRRSHPGHLTQTLSLALWPRPPSPASWLYPLALPSGTSLLAWVRPPDPPGSSPGPLAQAPSLALLPRHPGSGSPAQFLRRTEKYRPIGAAALLTIDIIQRVSRARILLNIYWPWITGFLSFKDSSSTK